MKDNKYFSTKAFSRSVFAVFVVLLFFGYSGSALAAKGIIKNIGTGSAPVNVTASDLGVLDVGTLPLSKWYFAKEWRRGFERLFTFNSVSKTELELRIMNEKAAEVLVTGEVHPENAEALALAFENYTGAVERLETRLTVVEETSENPRVEKLLLRIDEYTLMHAQLLQQLTERFRDDPYAEDANTKVVNPEVVRDNHLQGAADSAQRKIHEVVIAAAEKDKAILRKAEEQIKHTERVLGEIESRLAEFAGEQSVLTIARQTPKRDFGDRMKAGLDQAGGMLANGKARLVSAKSAFALQKFGEAFGEARSGEMLAVNAMRVFDGILRADQGMLEDEARATSSRSGRDADAPMIENGMKSVAPPMPNVPVPLTPAMRKTEERAAPNTQETTRPPVSPVTTTVPIVRDVSGYTFDIVGYVHDIFDAPAMTSGIPVGGAVLRATGPKTFTAQTRSTGYYAISFINAPLGTYEVCVTPPPGYRTNTSSGCETVIVGLSKEYDKTPELINNGNVALNGTALRFSLMREMDNGCPTVGPEACGKDGRTYYNTCFAAKAGAEVVACHSDVRCSANLPVCGKNGTTYYNVCFAERAPVEVAYEGECH